MEASLDYAQLHFQQLLRRVVGGEEVLLREGGQGGGENHSIRVFCWGFYSPASRRDYFRASALVFRFLCRSR